MAQPTIYADIDCNGQVEVKVNNDTGFACTIITSAGANDSVSSTGTDVYKYYNLTNSDWVKVVAAQDVTIAANKLTGTIKFGTFTTTSTTTAAPTTTTTTTPAGNVLPAGGADCDNPTTWPSTVLGTKYQVTISDTTTESSYYFSGVGSKKLYMSVVGDPSTAIGGSMKIGKCNDNTFPCIFTYSTATPASLQAGHDMSAASSGNFSIRGLAAGAVGTWDIWIDN
jgi:hypothetical protein